MEVPIALSVNSSGFVGIGTTNPSVALDVVGNVRCTAGIDLNYSTLPTYASNQIGYIMQYSSKLATSTSIFNSAKIAATFDSVPAGVWLCNVHMLANSSGDYGGRCALSTTNNVGTAEIIDMISGTETNTTFANGFSSLTYVIPLQNTSTRAIYVKFVSGGSVNFSITHSAYLIRIA